MARSIRALAGLARCERPTRAFDSTSTVQPGRLAHGPDEKFGLAGFTAGAVWGISAMATLPGRKLHVRVECPEARCSRAAAKAQGPMQRGADDMSPAYCNLARGMRHR